MPILESLVLLAKFLGPKIGPKLVAKMGTTLAHQSSTVAGKTLYTIANNVTATAASASTVAGSLAALTAGAQGAKELAKAYYEEMIKMELAQEKGTQPAGDPSDDREDYDKKLRSALNIRPGMPLAVIELLISLATIIADGYLQYLVQQFHLPADSKQNAQQVIAFKMADLSPCLLSTCHCSYYHRGDYGLCVACLHPENHHEPGRSAFASRSVLGGDDDPAEVIYWLLICFAKEIYLDEVKNKDRKGVVKTHIKSIEPCTVDGCSCPDWNQGTLPYLCRCTHGPHKLTADCTFIIRAVIAETIVEIRKG